MYGAPIKLKEDAVPRFFDCQEDHKRTASFNLPRPAYKKLKTMRVLNEMLAESKTEDKENIQSFQKEEEEVMLSIIEEPVIATSSTTNNLPVQRRDIIMHEENVSEPYTRSNPLEEIKSNKLMINKLKCQIFEDTLEVREFHVNF